MRKTHQPIFSTFNFDPKDAYTEEEIEKIVGFCEKAKITDLLSTIKTLDDYLLGVEVGLDTHARKNRSGKAMEILIYPVLERIKEKGYATTIIYQKQFEYLERTYNIPIPEKLRSRRFDIVCLKESKQICIEINYFSDTGSKPQEIVDSYIKRQNELKEAGWEFIWITDGPGWKNQRNQISKGFREIDFILNLYFVKKGLLEEILKRI